MKKLAIIAALATSFIASSALAVPVTWTLNNVTAASGEVLSGSFVYDADLDTYSAINVTSTGGLGPFTIEYDAGRLNSAGSLHLHQLPAGAGQNGLTLLYLPDLTNAGGSVTLVTGSNTSGLFTCSDPACTSGFYTVGKHIVSGTITGGAPATVPTMTEWAMILFGLILAGGAAMMIQRRRVAS